MTLQSILDKNQCSPLKKNQNFSDVDFGEILDCSALTFPNFIKVFRIYNLYQLAVFVKAFMIPFTFSAFLDRVCSAD